MAVHFQSYNDVLEIFKNKGLQYFILCDSRNLLEKNEKKDITSSQCMMLLEEMFERMTTSQATSNAAYQLRLYESLPIGGKLTMKTEFDYAYTFKLNEAAVTNNGVGYYNPTKMDRLLSNQEKIIEQQTKLLEEGEDAEDDSPNDYGLGKIGIALNHPRIAPAVEHLLNRIADMILPVGNKSITPAAVSGIPDNATDDDKIKYALAILKPRTPNFGDVLLRLASIAQNNPTQYNSLLSMLNFQ